MRLVAARTGTIEEAARVLGISPTNCTTRLNRALRKLEEALHVAA